MTKKDIFKANQNEEGKKFKILKGDNQPKKKIKNLKNPSLKC